MNCNKSIMLKALVTAAAVIIWTGHALPQNPPPAGRQDIPDIGTFIKIGSCGSPKISPITGELFFVSSMSGAPQLYRLTSAGWPYQLTFFDDGLDWHYLSPDGSRIIVGASVGGSEQSQLFLVQSEYGEMTQLSRNPDTQYGSVVWKKDGRGFYFRSNQENKRDFKLYYYDLITERDSMIFDMEGSNFIYGLSPDGRYLIFSHSFSNADNNLYLVDLPIGKAELLTPHKEEIIYDYPFIMPDNRTIYLTCNGNGEGTLKRARLDVVTKKIEYLDPDSPWTIDAIALSDNRRYIAWLVNEEGYANIKLWDLQENSPLPSPFLSGMISAVEVADNGRLVFPFSSPTKTQDIWLWDWPRQELRKLTNSSYAGVNQDLFIEPTLIKYRSFDGLEIPAFLYLPPDYNGKPVPFIIHAHGGPESQFRPYFQRNFQYLLLNGYGVLAPNIRGSSGYGRDFMNLDNFENRLNSIKDIKAACDYLIENKYSDFGLIGIKGTSYGGYVVLASITEYPDLFGAAFDEVGIANFVSFLRNTKEYRRQNREAEYGPLEDTTFLASISPIHKADRIRTPLLVAHGVNDPRVPIGEARQIIKAIQDKGGVVDSLIFPDEGHGVSKTANSIKLFRAMVEFFDRYLKKGN